MLPRFAALAGLDPWSSARNAEQRPESVAAVFRCGGATATLIGVHGQRREAATVAGYGSVGWHAFRHKYRTLLSEAGTPIDVQQKLLRHADICTTSQYGGVPMDNKRAANSRGPYPAEEMKAWKVSRAVGNVRNDEPGLVAPIP